MTILVIDTSTPLACVMLVSGEKITKRTWRATPQLGAALLEKINELVRAQNLDLHQIDRFAVHRGPGHFSALRVGLTVVTLLAVAYGAELVAVTGNGEAGLVGQAKNGTPTPTIAADYGMK